MVPFKAQIETRSGKAFSGEMNKRSRHEGGGREGFLIQEGSGGNVLSGSTRQ